jgi:hypothetical protein
MPSCAAYRGGCSSEVRTGLRPPVLRGFRRCRGARHPSALKGGISGGGCCGGNTPEPLAAALDGPIRSSGGELSGAPFSCAANNRTNRLKFSRCCETGRGRERRLSLAASRKGGGGMTHAPRGESVFGATDRGSSGPQIPGFSRLKKFGLLLSFDMDEPSARTMSAWVGCIPPLRHGFHATGRRKGAIPVEPSQTPVGDRAPRLGLASPPFAAVSESSN